MMMTFERPRFVMVLLLLLAVASSSARAEGRDGDTVLRTSVIRAAGIAIAAPTIAEVIAAAERAAGLDRDPSRGWIARARIAGLVPWVTVRTGRDTSWKNDGTDVGHGMDVEVRATWRLDRLVFDGRELQVASARAARRRERMRLAGHVIRAYFAWRRVIEHATDPPAECDEVADKRTCATRAVRIDEATAELDALTDGWFSAALDASARGLPRRRTGRN